MHLKKFGELFRVNILAIASSVCLVVISKKSNVSPSVSLYCRKYPKFCSNRTFILSWLQQLQEFITECISGGGKVNGVRKIPKSSGVVQI